MKNNMNNQWIKLHLNHPGSLHARALSGYVAYRCYSRNGWVNREISKHEIGEALCLTVWEVRKALKECRDLGSIQTIKGSRPGAPNVFTDPTPAGDILLDGENNTQEDTSRGMYTPPTPGDTHLDGENNTQEDTQEDTSRGRCPSDSPVDTHPTSGYTHPTPVDTHPTSGYTHPILTTLKKEEEEERQAGRQSLKKGSQPRRPASSACGAFNPNPNPPNPEPHEQGAVVREGKPPHVIQTGLPSPKVIVIPGDIWVRACQIVLVNQDPKAEGRLEAWLIERAGRGPVKNWGAILGAMIRDGELVGLTGETLARCGAGLEGSPVRWVDDSEDLEDLLADIGW